ncbi:IS110 family transposase [Streptomyces sp. YGL11-2]|uniref:IS110 family transposase n=1 Tax=Streptomyces sp. YGL11-2 TaxID=3414028 RepID=UPI003CF5D66D
MDVPASATSRVRQLAHGGGRKNDRIDAAAVATTHIHGDGREVNVDDHTTALALLDERCVNLAQARVRTVKQLRAVLRDLLPGGAPPQLSADQAAALYAFGGRLGWGGVALVCPWRQRWAGRWFDQQDSIRRSHTPQRSSPASR